MSAFQEINFHPWFHNVLDWTGEKGLVTIGGIPVRVENGNYGFSIYVNGALKHQGLDNQQASYVLNQMQTGLMQP